jgi:anti-sigma factor RsiW
MNDTVSLPADSNSSVVDPAPMRIKAGGDLERRLMSVLVSAHPTLRAELAALKRMRVSDATATPPLRDFILTFGDRRMEFSARVNTAGYAFTGIPAPTDAKFVPSKPGAKTLANDTDFKLEIGPLLEPARVRIPAGSRTLAAE